MRSESLKSLVNTGSSLAAYLSAALLAAFGAILTLVADLLLSASNSPTIVDLERAGSWLLFVAALALLFGTVNATWHNITKLAIGDALITGAISTAVLVLAVGQLVVAISAASEAGAILLALGFAGFGAILLVHAARRSIREHQSSLVRKESALWLVAAVGLFAIAASNTIHGQTLSDVITNNSAALFETITALVGYGLITSSIVLALGRKLLHTPLSPIPTFLLGLSNLAEAIGVAVAFNDTTTVTSIKVALSMPEGLLVLGWLAAALLAWRRLLAIATHSTTS